jgi:hypothetical protein
MSNFYVILPSNTGGAEGNRTNSFRVRLPRTLQFNSDWSVGLAVLVYPHTWPSLGTTEEQFVRIVWKTGDQIDIPLPSSNLQNPEELLKKLKDSLQVGSQEMVGKLRTLQMDSLKMHTEINSKMSDFLASIKTHPVPTENGDGESVDVKAQEKEYLQRVRSEALARWDPHDRAMLEKTREMGLAAWIEVFRRARFACNFEFNADGRQRFRVHMENKFVERVEMSAQLAYIMGFSHPIITKTTDAPFVPDMKGGVSSFFIYSPGLIEPVIIGDVTVPVLRIVNIRGTADENVEETYMPIQYHKLLVKEISEITIEIRTPSGALMPFQYGTCTLTLHFKKNIYF